MNKKLYSFKKKNARLRKQLREEKLLRKWIVQDYENNVIDLENIIESLRSKINKERRRTEMLEETINNLVKQNRKTEKSNTKIINKNQELIEENLKLEKECANLRQIIRIFKKYLNDKMEEIREIKNKKLSNKIKNLFGSRK